MWHYIDSDTELTGTALRFTGKSHYIIMFMLKVIPTTKYPFQIRNICILTGAFYAISSNPKQKQIMPVFHIRPTPQL